MQLKNIHIVNFLNGIQELKGKHLPVKLGYAIYKNEKALEDCAAGYEAERMKIVDKYAKKKKNGEYEIIKNQYDITDKKAYSDELNALLEISNQVELHTVDYNCVEQCGAGQYDALSVRDLEVLEIMITE